MIKECAIIKIEVMKVLTEKRQEIMVNYIDDHKICRVADLSKVTSSSPATVRRDLASMEKRGIIKRIHGGARTLKNQAADIAQHIRFNLNRDLKRQIAQYAVKIHISPGMTIFLDAGTTIYEMVPFLTDIQDITVVTNGLETAQECINAGIFTIMLGGLVKKDTHATVGQSVLRQLGALNLSCAFIGANGLNKNGQYTTPDIAEADVKQKAIKQAEFSYVLMDKTKIARQTFATFGDCQHSVLITNKINEKQRQELPAKIKIEEIKI